MMKKLLIAFLLAGSICRAQNYSPTWESLDSRPVPQWFKDSKFGIFIHWGVYAVPGFCSKGNYSEWYQHGLSKGDTARVKFHKAKFGNQTYYQFADQFKAELFNPDEWAKLFEKSGAKYIVLTSKHHDGYALWPSKETDQTWGFPWNSQTTGPHRDLIGDLFKAVRKTSVHAGMYYSLYEWFNPLWLKDKDKYVAQHQWPQMKELINKYQPDVFWTDGDWDATAETWKSKEFLAWLYNESPVKQSIVTYDRWGSGVRFKHGAVYTPEYQPNLDFEDHYWEESRGMGFSYGYNREEDAWDYNSAQSLILQLVDKVSRGGNFLLDIGPDEHGKIPPIMQERLLEIGKWMSVNGEAIYGTQRWKVPSQWSEGRTDYKAKNGDGDYLLKITVDPEPGYAVKDVFFTYHEKTNNLYAILPKYPSNRKIVLQHLVLDKATQMELLATKEKLTWKQVGENVEVTLPSFDPNQITVNYAYVIKVVNAGSFVKKPKIEMTYANGALTPQVSITAPGSEVRYTLDGSTPNENALLYTKPITSPTSARLKAIAFRKGAIQSDTVGAYLKVFQWKNAMKSSKKTTGLSLKVYEGKFISVDEMERLDPVKKFSGKNISLADTTKSENIGLVYEGLIEVKADAIYDFHLSSDDGSKLWISGELLNHDGLHGNEEKTMKIALKKGLHPFRLAYFQGTGGAGLQLKVSSPNIKKQLVPNDWFFTN